jgi:hypothetical protein
MLEDVVGPVLAALLTIMMLSYIIGDNPFFRLACYIFIGVASGYAGAIAWHQVLWPGLGEPITQNGLATFAEPGLILTVVVPLVLIALMLFKLSASTARYGTLPLALMVGIGAGVLIGGAITGTLIPQSLAAMTTLDPSAIAPQTGETGIERVVNVVILLVGTLTTLMYFRFTATRGPSGETRRTRLMSVIAGGGGFFIALTFGVMYAGALAASVIVLSERVQFLAEVIVNLLGRLTGAG